MFRKSQVPPRRPEQPQAKFVCAALAAHFPGVATAEIVSSSRLFPGHMRADLQTVVENLFDKASVGFFGVLEAHRYETLTVAALTHVNEHAPVIAPVQYQDVDIGEADLVRCLVNGLWLCRDGDLAYAVLLSHHREFGQEAGLRVEIAAPGGERAARFTQDCFRDMEAAVNRSRAYRGKILSLEQGARYTGRSSGVRVHRLPMVSRDDVILSPQTLELLDRNVFRFVGCREGLKALGQSTKKGILLYGPPGTGKTHTIRYLATNLPGHTTLIITAEQVGLLAEYIALARLLQPTMLVIEDADLIARMREDMGGPCEEALLNKLLNEMDGLREDADILFVLTTNRPEQLETALASRPGRIDQAIEIPLPDDVCRERLVRLYGKELRLPEPLLREAVRRTKGVSAAFIKELMRRAAQASLTIESGAVTLADLTQALDDMLFVGGRLNARLLGGDAGSETFGAAAA